MYNKIQFIKKEMKKLHQAVDFCPERGARCPCCGKRTKIIASKPWISHVKIRYHKCENPLCFAHIADKGIKSIQEVKP
jgi:hypothetical protein